MTWSDPIVDEVRRGAMLMPPVSTTTWEPFTAI